MSAAQEAPPQAGEVDRFEAQRQAFSRLMARFTADRDAMIAAVQQCNERIDGLTSRLGAGEIVAASDGSGNAAGLTEARALTERLLTQQQIALTEVRTASDRALQRADEALRRWRETAEQVAEKVAEKETGSDGARQAVEKVAERLTRLEELFMAQSAEPPPVVDETITRAITERLSVVEEQMHGVEESFESVRHQVERPPPVDASAPLLDAGLRDLREQMMQLESIATWTPKLQRLWVSLVASAVVAAFAVVYIR